MNIEQLGVRITGIVGFTSITVEPDGVIILLGSERERLFNLDEARELRDALTAAIEHAERMSGAPAGATEPQVFTVGQELTGDEDLPIGTVIRDNDDNSQDEWVLGLRGWGLVRGVDREGDAPLPEIMNDFGGATIVSLP